eukprot:TRINITY_DN92690_c0_g1_i1.p1 TRINITY_DN92690_c0_g1~~TRINITY_DN92690_c0_g1_i1.p1  ORF type:complete len:363 (+),score=48.71 TRINITY_DN92690_c0_g1_i1:112-1200(+)
MCRGRSLCTGPSNGEGPPESDIAPPFALSSLLAKAEQDPRKWVRVHAHLRELHYPVLKRMKAESRDFFNAHVLCSTSTTLAESYLTISGMSRCDTIEWLLRLGTTLMQEGFERFDRPLLWKALHYLDGFYSSAARSMAEWSGTGYARERAFAACLVAWKMNQNDIGDHFYRAIQIMSDQMNVRLNLSVVVRMERELVSMLDYKISSPSVCDLAEAVNYYFMLLGSSGPSAAPMYADMVMRIAHVLVTDGEIAGRVEPVRVVLVALQLALQLCNAPAAVSALLEQDIRKMFDEPTDPVDDVLVRCGCASKLRSMFMQSRSESAVDGNGDQLLLVALRKESAAAVDAAFESARMEKGHSTGATP